MIEAFLSQNPAQQPPLNGQRLAKICKETPPSPDDALLLVQIQNLMPGFPVRLARTGNEWYRLGGIVDCEGHRIATDLAEWSERTFIECGRNLQTLIDHARLSGLIATRQTGNTLYFVIQTGNKAENFIQLDIDRTHEVTDRHLVSPTHPPEDLEEFIDPLDPEYVKATGIGTVRYAYRRKTDVSVFMSEINDHHREPHPVRRFMNDWDRSSAGQKFWLSNDWIVRPFRHTGRFGEQQINIELIHTQTKNLPQLDDLHGKKGVPLHNLLTHLEKPCKRITGLPIKTG